MNEKRKIKKIKMTNMRAGHPQMGHIPDLLCPPRPKNLFSHKKNVIF